MQQLFKYLVYEDDIEDVDDGIIHVEVFERSGRRERLKMQLVENIEDTSELIQKEGID